MKLIYLLALLILLNSCDIMPSNGTIYQPNSSSSNSENKEFATLMEKDQMNKTQVTSEVLTYLLNDSDPKEKKTAAVIENLSNCNIIVRLVNINSSKIYNLPIVKNSKNQFVIIKGNYTLKSNVCTAKYYSQKNISEPLLLKLGNN